MTGAATQVNRTTNFQRDDYAAEDATTGFTLSDREFDELRAIIKERTGISISDSKRQMLRRRFSSHLKELKLGSIREYCKYLKSADEFALEKFCNAVTTNLTSFFRERHHFDYLEKTIIPELVAEKKHANKRLRIWSAGCSTGEEPYSIAITLREAIPDLKNWDARLLCTDLDTKVLETCRAGVYAQERVEKISKARLSRWFKKSRGQDTELVKVDQSLQELIAFKQLNLMHKWPMKGPFDIIFCRNVIIYFDKPTQRVLIDRYAELLKDGGYLILGHSESLFRVSERFSLLGNTIYQKTH